MGKFSWELEGSFLNSSNFPFCFEKRREFIQIIVIGLAGILTNSKPIRDLHQKENP
jgi:hypothetical protein